MRRKLRLTSRQKRIAVAAIVLIVLLVCLRAMQWQDAARWQALQRESSQRQTLFTKLIQEHRVAVGMTADQVRQSIGEPNRINRTVARTSIYEEWAYGKTNLYLENGVVRNVQEWR